MERKKKKKGGEKILKFSQIVNLGGGRVGGGWSRQLQGGGVGGSKHPGVEPVPGGDTHSGLNCRSVWQCGAGAFGEELFSFEKEKVLFEFHHLFSCIFIYFHLFSPFS